MRWFEGLSEEDMQFIRRFILASGSLKEMAGFYGISYPTVRLRLDRLIQKIQILESHQEQSRFEKILRMRFAEGKLDNDTFRALLKSYSEEKENEDE